MRDELMDDTCHLDLFDKILNKKKHIKSKKERAIGSPESGNDQGRAFLSLC